MSFINMDFFCFFIAGLQRIYNARDESTEGTESHKAYHTQGDREDGSDYSQKVLEHPDAAETIDLRGCYDTEESIPRREVRRDEALSPMRKAGSRHFHAISSRLEIAEIILLSRVSCYCLYSERYAERHSAVSAETTVLSRRFG